MQAIRKFITSDNTEFDTKAEALAHEKTLKAGAKADAIRAKLEAQHVELAPLQHDFDTLPYLDFLARHADVLKRALTVATHKPRHPKQAAQA